jgi:hypothetical protein
MIELVFTAALASVVPRILERVDPIKDTTSVYAVIGDAKQHLAIGCDNISDRSSIRVVVRYERYIGEATPGILMGGVNVQYRFDKRPAETVRWYSHDREIMAESERTNPLKFMIDMKGSTGVVIRTTKYDGDFEDLVLQYANPDAIIERVFVRCGFNPDGSDPTAPFKRRRK